MASKPRAPLTPADSEYVGLDSDDHHLLRWRSQSRPDLTHDTFMDSFGVNYWCTCEWYAHHGECKHGRAALDALAHHGVTLGPPADPGDAVGEPPELAGLTECEDAARDAGTLDDLVAAGGDRWIVGRWGARWGEAQPPASARVTLTCVGCHRTRVFPDEAAAAAFVRADGACGCGGAGPPPPAHGAARKPLKDHLALLYGE